LTDKYGNFQPSVKVIVASVYSTMAYRAIIEYLLPGKIRVKSGKMVEEEKQKVAFRRRLKSQHSQLLTKAVWRFETLTTNRRNQKYTSRGEITDFKDRAIS